jgi:hypothetical protein
MMVVSSCCKETGSSLRRVTASQVCTLMHRLAEDSQPTPVSRANDGTRTRDPHLGKVMRYQLRYVRIRRAGRGILRGM